MEELGDVGEGVATEGSVGGGEVGVLLVLLLGKAGHITTSIVGDEDLDSVRHCVDGGVLARTNRKTNRGNGLI